METSGLLLYHGAMKYTVTNNSSAPHDLLTQKGRVVVLAGQSVDVEFDAGSAEVYGAVPFFDVKLVRASGGRVESARVEVNEPRSESVTPRKPGRPRKDA